MSGAPVGLTLPHLSEPDPELAGEGALDPLGLFSVADRLAEEIAPGITARMFRVRFLTAMAVSAAINEGLGDIVPADSGSTPELAFEWLLVEALVRRLESSPSATLRVPGSDKARSVVSRDGHLGSSAYLKTPKVFGFHGVYKRLAIALGIVDANLSLLERGNSLLRTWETEQGLDGFVDRRPDTNGGSLALRLEEATCAAARAGRVQESPKVAMWSDLARVLRPDAAGAQEKRLLWDWLVDETEPVRRELVGGIQRLEEIEDEASALRALRQGASADLGLRLDAIDSYERFSELIQGSFDWLRYYSTQRGTSPLVAATLPSEGLPGEVLRLLPQVTDTVARRLAPLGLEMQFEGAFGRLRTAASVADLAQLLFERHDQVQRAKPPHGKRSWFDSATEGVVVRLPYRLPEAPALTGAYLHPYRVFAIWSFLEDLK